MKKIDNSTMGGRIKEQRIKMGMTQEELAEKMFTSKMTISHYENNQTDIKGSVIVEIAEILGTTTGYLLSNEIVLGNLDEQMNEMMLIFQGLGNDEIREVAMEQVKLLLKMRKLSKK